MESTLKPLDLVLDQADARARSPIRGANQIWPTGFAPLDDCLSGGLRAGELILLGGAQGLGKTTLAVQMARNTARLGRSAVIFSYEHDHEATLIRLVALEAGYIGAEEAPSVAQIRAAFESTDGLGLSLSQRLSHTQGGPEALEVVREYADRIAVHRSTGTATGIESISAFITEAIGSTGQAPLVIVDYLQKVAVPGADELHLTSDDRSTRVVEGLKDLALDHGVPVLAVVASDKDGIGAGRRMRGTHFRGSSAIAYEADTVLILNSKADIIAKQHLVYNLNRVDEYRKWAVLTIEKNRAGEAGIDLEFRKRFEQSRYDHIGNRVKETLIDDRVFSE